MSIKDLRVKVEAKTDFELFGAVLNDDKDIEFQFSNSHFVDKMIERGSKALYRKGYIGIIGSEKIVLKLESKESKKVEEFKSEVLRDLSSLYKNIIRGSEDIMLLRLDDDFCIATTEKILDRGRISNKYNKALEYCFSDKLLKSMKRIPLGIKDNSHMQRTISAATKGKINYGEDQIKRIKYSDLLQLIYAHQFEQKSA